MDPRLQSGFLGTGASLMSDLSLLAYVILLVPAMLVGFVFARRRMHRPHHQYTMILITLVNWLLILFLMAVSYARGVVPGIPANLGQPAIFLPTLHLIFGAVAQLLATYTLYRMWREDAQVAAARKRGEKELARYWFKNAKPVMRTILALWLLTAALGFVTYFTFYTRRPADAAPAPAATEQPTVYGEAGEPEVTPDTQAPAETPEVTPETSG